MKTLQDYTIYCTPEQTKKALELGAPIEFYYGIAKPQLPTAEQMMGWLRSKGFLFKTVEHKSDVYWQYVIEDYLDRNRKPSAKEATLAAIDAALDYLTQHKKKL